MSQISSTSEATLESQRHAGLRGAVRVRVLAIEQVDPVLEQQWTQLCRRDETGNPFLSPHYVIPAAKNCATKSPVFIVMERGDQLVGLGIFQEESASRRMPLPHLRSWQSPHGFLDGMLIDESHAEIALTAFWNYLQHSPEGWNAVEFPKLALDQRMVNSLQQTASRAGVEFWMGKPVARAAMQVSSDLNDRMLSKISTKRARSLRRGWKYLEKQGEVSFSIKTSSEEVTKCTEDLLRLEALGWKSEVGTALVSQPDQELFFRSMIDRFAADQQVFFTQLKVAEKVIATVVHLRVGTTAYAFKIGWDPDYERGCPGFQIKSQFVKCTDELSGIQLIDSCSCYGSFIEHVWPDARTIAPHIFMTTRAGVLAGSLVGGLRWVRDRAGKLLEMTGVT